MNCFIHADMDAFYASVEQLDHPEYRGKPVIVGGLPGDRRSVVSAASYEARAWGIHSAMPLVQAVKLCPGGIYLRGNMKRYREKSKEVMAVFAEFSPELQQLSIDEAFLNITGTEKLFGPPKVLAGKLKKAVYEKTGLTVSAGIASNKYVAKIASGMSKPDGLYIVPPGEEEQFMLSLPAGKIWGAGGKTQELFARHGFKTCADLHRLSRKLSASVFGQSFGDFIYRAVRGEAAETFEAEREIRSMSAERTFSYDLYDEFEMETQLFDMASEVFFRLLQTEFQSRTIFIKIRYGEDFSTISGRETFQTPLGTLNEFYEKLLVLFRRKYRTGQGIRLLGAGLGNLETKNALRQKEFFNDAEEKQEQLEQSILKINAKFPGAALKRGRSWLA
ncbi:MAG: DNA polymerase IV [Spirochaetaceae bacterium]|jgi:DNA polymerase-4|nr:DNA polymerase IV [Spirochaetaceae bacterium]